MSDTKTSETSAAGAGGDAGAGNPKTAAKILKQVNYYFSVHNLPNDKFLLAETKKDAEGWVAIETLLKFNRLKALTTDASVVAAALGTSEVVAVNEAGDKVRRKEAIPEGVSFDDCTLYVVRCFAVAVAVAVAMAMAVARGGAGSVVHARKLHARTESKRYMLTPTFGAPARRKGSRTTPPWTRSMRRSASTALSERCICASSQERRAVSRWAFT